MLHSVALTRRRSVGVGAGGKGANFGVGNGAAVAVGVRTGDRVDVGPGGGVAVDADSIIARTAAWMVASWFGVAATAGMAGGAAVWISAVEGPPAQAAKRTATAAMVINPMRICRSIKAKMASGTP